jgi:putative peptidoglycan lipid II flippase
LRLHIIKSSLAVTAFAGLTAVAGFFGQVVIAKLFGASAPLDAYLTAGAIPNTMAAVLLWGVGYTLIPILSGTPKEEVPRALTSCFLVVLVLSVALAGVGILAGKPLLRWTAPYLAPEKLALAAELQIYFWLGAAFSILTGFVIGVSQFSKRFVIPAAATLAPPLMIIVCGLSLAHRMGIRSIAWGFLLGALLQCVLVVTGIWGKGNRWSSGFSPAAWKFLRSLFPATASLLPFTLFPAIDAFWSSRLADGSFSLLGYANRISIGLTSVTIQGMATVIFPYLSENAASRDLEAVRRQVALALRLVFLLMVPIAAVLTALRIPVLTLLFQRGKFDAAATRGLASVLPWYLVGMVGIASMNLVNRGFYALRDFRTPARIGVGFLCGYFVLSGLLSFRFAYVGIAATYAIYWVAQLACAQKILSRRLGKVWEGRELKFLGKVIAAGVIVAVLLQAGLAHQSWILAPLAQVVCFGLAGSVLVIGLGYLTFNAYEREWAVSLATRVLRAPWTRGISEAPDGKGAAPRVEPGARDEVGLRRQPPQK